MEATWPLNQSGPLESAPLGISRKTGYKICARELFWVRLALGF